jgi:hypothetical protein
MLEITSTIKGIRYKHFLQFTIPTYESCSLVSGLENSCFRLKWNDKVVYTVSRWVSPKRTRSYPYVNVYKTLTYSDGKKVTIIPVIKDEGINGDRDFIQWDTISMMSLLGVYVILAYYKEASYSTKEGKITNQKFDYDFIKLQLSHLNDYKSDALHWNLDQASSISSVMELAHLAYHKISEDLNVQLHSESQLKSRIVAFYQDIKDFKEMSRIQSVSAQTREINTTQPKELVNQDLKAKITITNYLKGMYHLTVDEALIENDNILLIEAKHTKKKGLPSTNDILDGVLKLILYCNLEKAVVNNQIYNPIPILKLTSIEHIQESLLTKKQREFLELVKQEAQENGFRLVLE